MMLMVYHDTNGVDGACFFTCCVPPILVVVPSPRLVLDRVLLLILLVSSSPLTPRQILVFVLGGLLN